MGTIVKVDDGERKGWSAVADIGRLGDQGPYPPTFLSSKPPPCPSDTHTQAEISLLGPALILGEASMIYVLCVGCRLRYKAVTVDEFSPLILIGP